MDSITKKRGGGPRAALLATAFCALALGAAACVTPTSGLGAERDTGTPPSPDTGVPRPDTGVEGPDSGGPLPAVSGDFSCLGRRLAPEGAFTSMHRFQATTFLGDPAAGATLQLFPDNLPNTGSDGCAGSCVELPLDASGTAVFAGSLGGWFAARIIGDATRFFRTVAINRPADSDASYSLLAADRDTIMQLQAALRRELDPRAGHALGVFQDCAGDPVRNARLRVFQGGTELLSGPAPSPLLAHFGEGGLPQPIEDLPRSTSVGAYLALNLPAGPTRVEAWGARSVSGPEERLGCEPFLNEAETLTIVDIGPLRADASPECGP